MRTMDVPENSQFNMEKITSGIMEVIHLKLKLKVIDSSIF